MSLTEDLQTLRAQFNQNKPDAIRATMTQATEDLAQSGLVDRSLKVGDRAPEFTLPNAVSLPVKLSNLLAKGSVVISFYRGGWCPYCNLELRALQQALPEIQAQGATLVAISPETPDNSLSTTEKNELTFEVLSDQGNQVARQYGLVFTLSESLRPIYEGFGIDLPTYNGDDTFELPLPATYVVAPGGQVTFAFANADYTIRLEPAEIVAALKAFPVQV